MIFWQAFAGSFLATLVGIVVAVGGWAFADWWFDARDTDKKD